MFVWFIVFLYFLVIDFFIFKQNWFAVILSLAVGFIIFLLYILIKLIVGPKTQKNTTQSIPPQQSQQIQSQTTSAETIPQPQQTITKTIPQPTPVIKKETVLTKPKSISLPLILFIIQIIILIGLTLYLVLG